MRRYHQNKLDNTCDNIDNAYDVSNNACKNTDNIVAITDDIAYDITTDITYDITSHITSHIATDSSDNGALTALDLSSNNLAVYLGGGKYNFSGAL
jgi:hypothetical protein